MKTRNQILTILALLALAGSVIVAAPLGTAFTYQGRLTSGTNVVAGAFDFRSMIFDLASGGSPLAGPLTNTAVAISNGLFTVPLDFGGVFDGRARWLEIGVRTNGSGTFTALSPRQAMTPTPYALYTPSATTATTASSVVAGSIGNAALAANAVTSDKIADGTIVNADISASGLDAGKIVGGDLQATRLKVGSGPTLTGTLATIAGGDHNSAVSPYTVIGGGYYNVAANAYATVAGGAINIASNNYSAVGGGANNVAGGENATVAGGRLNVASGPGAFVGGGGWDGNFAGGNRASGNSATIGGGLGNTADASLAFIGGGRNNTVSHVLSTIGGGEGNSTSGLAATIGGGTSNSVTHFWATVAGGSHNIASGAGAFVGGGGWDGENVAGNTASDRASMVGGGTLNTASGSFATVGGGYNNRVAGPWSLVSGGGENYATNGWSTVGGGGNNVASGQGATVAGGVLNTASGPGAFIGGGGTDGTPFYYAGNTAGGAASVIGGGLTNNAGSYYATIGGGIHNVIEPDSQAATIGGGYYNAVGSNAFAAAISGGGWNEISSNVIYATVPGGAHNLAGGNFSFAAGQRAKALHAGTFVWADSTSADFASTGLNQFLVRASGGVGLAVSNPQHQLDVGGQALVRGPSFGGPGDSAALFLGDVNHSIRSVWGSGLRLNTFQVPDGITLLERSGNVGIGTNNPQARLHVASAGGSPQLRLDQNTDGDYARLRFQQAGAHAPWDLAVGGGANVMNFWNGANGNVMTLDQAGNLTITGTYSPPSDRHVKTNFARVDGREILARVAALPIQRWTYTNDLTTPHLGPVAQDFHAAFGLGADDKHITTVDADGVALAAIQGLNEKAEVRSQKSEAKSQKLEEKLQQKEAEIAELKQTVNELKELMKAMNDKLNGETQ